MELASQLKHSGIPLLLINQEIFGKRSYKRQPAELLTDIRNYADTFEYTKQVYMAQYGDVYGEAAVPIIGMIGGPMTFMAGQIKIRR